jgi:hypothetical protein
MISSAAENSETLLLASSGVILNHGVADSGNRPCDHTHAAGFAGVPAAFLNPVYVFAGLGLL